MRLNHHVQALLDGARTITVFGYQPPRRRRRMADEHFRDGIRRGLRQADCGELIPWRDAFADLDDEAQPPAASTQPNGQRDTRRVDPLT